MTDLKGNPGESEDDPYEKLYNKVLNFFYGE